MRVCWFICWLFACTLTYADTQVQSEFAVNLINYTDAPPENSEQLFIAAIFQPQLTWVSSDQDNQLNIQLFYLHDSVDEQRTHFDIREFNWLYQAETWEVAAGISKVFWGVVESRNIVNVINQQDVAYGFDKAYRLGQPLVRATFDQEEAGVFDLYILPFFRVQTRVGEENPAFITDAAPVFQDQDEENHVDFAFRYSNFIEEHEFALSYFQGTDRIPIYIFSDNELRPFYRQIKQFGLEYQFSNDGWLWKLEAIHKSFKDDIDFFASVFGFEYTLVGIYADTDLGLLAEVNWDERGESSFELLQNDTFLATRFALNDVDGTEFILGVSIDNNHLSQTFTLTGSKRFGNDWKANISAFIFNLDSEELLASRLNRSSYLELQISYFL